MQKVYISFLEKDIRKFIFVSLNVMLESKKNFQCSLNSSDRNNFFFMEWVNSTLSNML